MQEQLFISVAKGLVKMARVEDGRLADFAVESVSNTQETTGHIYLGRVLRVVPRLQAAFVDIGEDSDGFLGAREARILLEGNPRDADIQECVAEGDDVLVQITRPASGDKGAALTANVTLPGRNLVLTPCHGRISVSRSIESEDERNRLTTMAESLTAELEIEGMDGPAGWVLRTAAENMTEDALKAEMQSVAKSWDGILDKADAQEKAGLLYSDIGGVEKILRDYVRASTAEIVIEGDIEGDAALHVAQAYVKQTMSELLDRVKPAEKGEDLFERHDIHGEIDKALGARFNLPSGGWIMIEYTEAMTAIDVNSGSHNDPALAVNLEAAEAIARQIRLRSIGGLIAVDFIDMDKPEDAEAVLSKLEIGFKGDKVPTRLGDMSDFWVVEMTRKRERLPLYKALAGA